MSAAVHLVRLDVARFTLPLARPLTTAVGPITEREVVVLRAVDERGQLALGEAAPLPGFSPENIDDVARELDAIAAAPLTRAGFRRPDDVTAWLRDTRLSGASRHALEQAALGLLAARRGVALGELLHPGARRTLPIHALVTDAEDARAVVTKGAKTLKIKVGAATREDDAARLVAIRAAVGPDVSLRLDANGAYTVPEAITAIALFARSGLIGVEQPVAADALEGMARVRRACGVPILADESVRTLDDLRAVIRHEAADVIVLKPMLAGGLLDAYAMAALAAQAGLPVSVTTTFEGAIGRHAAVELAAACPGTLWTCGLDTARFLAQDLVPSADAPVGVTLGALAPDADDPWARPSRTLEPEAHGTLLRVGGVR
jgi:o-succinylbenzoate synthase